MSIRPTRPEHEVVFRELCELVGRNSAEMTSLEVLAVAANMVGKLIAMQDQRAVSPDMAMEIVRRNIELGNEQALAYMTNSRGTA